MNLRHYVAFKQRRSRGRLRRFHLLSSSKKKTHKKFSEKISQEKPKRQKTISQALRHKPTIGIHNLLSGNDANDFLDYLSKFNTRHLFTDTDRNLVGIPKLKASFFSSPGWVNIKEINDTSLKSKEQVDTWITQVGEVVKSSESHSWFTATSWASIARDKISQKNSVQLVALLQACFNRNSTWDDFRVQLKSTVNPESETKSECFFKLQSSLLKPHYVDNEVVLAQEYAKSMFKLTYEHISSGISWNNPEEEQEFEKYFKLIQGHFMERCSVDLLLSTHKQELQSWDKTTFPVDTDCLQLSQWIAAKNDRQRVVLNGASVTK